MIKLGQYMRLQVILFVITLLPFFSIAQVPNPALIGYFQNWHTTNTPYIQLDQIDPRYNIIDVAFAIPQAGTDYKMEFIPYLVSPATFISQIQVLQSQGKKVLISMGGATAPVSLGNITERDSFITSMSGIINMYGFDGIDIDFEGASLAVSGGTISSPVDQPVINLIYAVKQIMANYFTLHNKRLILTMAPETAFVQGGQSSYGGIWGAYLPLIDALRDSLEILHVQLYNSGSMYGVDGSIYTQGTADFIVAMCEAVIQGFNTAGGAFAGLPPHKVAVGLPSCTLAAGGGFTDTAIVKSAVDYLRGNGIQPGSYSLVNTSGYPSFRGMMTWSINWDAVASCGGVYEYAENFENIFSTTTSIASIHTAKKYFIPNPQSSNNLVEVKFNGVNKSPIVFILNNNLGQLLRTETCSAGVTNFKMNTGILQSGIYYLESESHDGVFTDKIVVE